MAKLYASWAHGNVVVAESAPGQPVRQGFGSTFRLPKGQGSWFHAPIPTPVLVEDRRATLGKVMVLFDARGTAALTAVHVFDGPNRIKKYENLSVKGDYAHGISDKNQWQVGHDGIAWGVGITMFFTAGAVDSEIFFSTVGVDFYHNI